MKSLLSILILAALVVAGGAWLSDSPGEILFRIGIYEVRAAVWMLLAMAAFVVAIVWALERSVLLGLHGFHALRQQPAGHAHYIPPAPSQSAAPPAITSPPAPETVEPEAETETEAEAEAEAETEALSARIDRLEEEIRALELGSKRTEALLGVAEALRANPHPDTIAAVESQIAALNAPAAGQ